jgi:hypothetical protein
VEHGLVSQSERRIAARIRLWSGVTTDVGKAVAVALWIAYLVVALINGEPVVSM